MSNYPTDENGDLVPPYRWMGPPQTEEGIAAEKERERLVMEMLRKNKHKTVKFYARGSVTGAAQGLVSIERATLELKGNQPLRVYGSILVIAITPVSSFRLYETDSTNPRTLSAGELIDLPLIFPDWSVCNEDIVGFDVNFYDAEDDGDKPKPFLSRRDPCEGGLRAYDRPLKFIAENDQAVFTLYYTRISMACSAYIRFRVFDCVKGEYELGECWANGSIKAKRILVNGESLSMSPVFESSEAVKFMGPSIPLHRTVLVVPVQFVVPVESKQQLVPVQLKQQLDDGNGGWVQLNFDLELGTAVHGNIIVQGEAKLILQQYNKVLSPFSLRTEITSRKRKISNADSDSDSDALKIEIMVTPFWELERIYNDTTPLERELL